MSFVKIVDIETMDGLTVKEIAERLGITSDTAKKRLQKHKLTPKEYAGPTALYDPSVVDKIRKVAPVGRPKKAAEPAKPKSKKAKK